jgi:hypothetical protein
MKEVKAETNIYLYENSFPEEFCKNVIEKYEISNARIKGAALFREQVEEIEVPTLFDPTDPDFDKETAELWEGIDAQIEDYARKCLDGYMSHYMLKPYEYEYVGCKMLYYPPFSFSPVHYDDELVASDGGNIGSCRPINLVVYLNEEFEAGETLFLDQNVAVKPKTGMTAIFPASYMYPHTTTPTEGAPRYILLPFFRKAGLNAKIQNYNEKLVVNKSLVNKMRSHYSPEREGCDYEVVPEITAETKR